MYFLHSPNKNMRFKHKLYLKKFFDKKNLLN